MAKRIRIAGADITLASMSADEKRQLILAARFAVRHNRGGWDEAKRQIRVARRLFDAEVSMAARNSPESSGRNSPLHSDSVTAKSLRRSDIGEGIEVEIDDLLKRLGGDTVAQAFGQGVGPGGILAL
jgi:hypothetical protein